MSCSETLVSGELTGKSAAFLATWRRAFSTPEKVGERKLVVPQMLQTVALSIEFQLIKRISVGNSLVVHWVGLCFHCQEHRFNPCQGTKILQVAWHGQKFFKTKFVICCMSLGLFSDIGNVFTAPLVLLAPQRSLCQHHTSGTLSCLSFFLIYMLVCVGILIYFLFIHVYSLYPFIYTSVCLYYFQTSVFCLPRCLNFHLLSDCLFICWFSVTVLCLYLFLYFSQSLSLLLSQLSVCLSVHLSNYLCLLHFCICQSQ